MQDFALSLCWMKQFCFQKLELLWKTPHKVFSSAGGSLYTYPATDPHIYKFYPGQLQTIFKVVINATNTFQLSFISTKIQQIKLQNIFLNQQNLHFSNLQSKINLVKSYQCNRGYTIHMHLSNKLFLWIHYIIQWINTTDVMNIK